MPAFICRTLLRRNAAKARRAALGLIAKCRVVLLALRAYTLSRLRLQFGVDLAYTRRSTRRHLRYATLRYATLRYAYMPSLLAPCFKLM